MDSREDVTRADLSNLRDTHAAKPQRLVMYTTSWCSDCTALKHYLTTRGHAFDEVNIEENEAAAELVMELNDGKRSVPTLMYGDFATSLSQFNTQNALSFLRSVGVEGED